VEGEQAADHADDEEPDVELQQARGGQTERHGPGLDDDHEPEADPAEREYRGVRAERLSEHEPLLARNVTNALQRVTHALNSRTVSDMNAVCTADRRNY
jgi:hypothetical protein